MVLFFEEKAVDYYNHCDMLKNKVYLGKSIWRKTRQASVGSKRQVKNDRSEWTIMEGDT